MFRFMEKGENLYGLLDKKIKENIENKRKNEKLEEKAKERASIRASINDRYYVVTNEIKAYFYYKYFMENIFLGYLKQHIKEIKDIDKNKAKETYFRLFLRVRYNAKIINEIDFQDFYQAFYLSFNKLIICQFFSEYMESFCKRVGVNKVFSFENIKIKDVLENYYGELQRFERTDELIKSIQEEENTFVNGEEVIKGIRKR